MDPLEFIQLPPLRRLSTALTRLVSGHLWAKVLLAMLLGVGGGMLLGPDIGLVERSVADGIARWAALPGTLFLGLIRMIVIPLVVASIVRGLGASESAAQLRALGLRGAAYFVVTTTVAIGLGLAAAMLIRPGRFVDPRLVRDVMASSDLPETADAPAFEGVGDFLVRLLPTNPLASMAAGDMLQVVFFAVILGVALVSLPADKSAPLFELLGSLQDVCMKVVAWAMRLAPIAVFGLTLQLSARIGLDVLAGMGVYVVTVLAGLAALLVVYCVLVAVVARRSPISFLRAVRPVLLLAFSTSSSAAVMPLSIETAEDELEVRPSIARFLIPLGATINMDGTALYQCVATVFLAQVFGIELGAAALVLLVVTAVAASIGSPATPGVGIVILATVLSSAGVPAAGIALILGVDRLLDMSRTALNVTGDLTACLVLDRWVPASGSARPHSEEP